VITNETPDKVADIIRDTWPQLYRSPAEKMKVEIFEHNDHFYWLIVYSRNHSVEGHAKTLKDAVKEILMYTEGV